MTGESGRSESKFIYAGDRESRDCCHANERRSRGYAVAIIARSKIVDWLETLHKYGFMGKQMKTTVEMPEELYRRAKALAALQGRRLKDLIEEGLHRVIASPRQQELPASLAELTRKARGVVDSGIPDLATNPEHLAGFGRDASRHR